MTGSLPVGFITGLVLFHGVPREIQVIVGVGFCGGYTTLSTARVETVRRIQRQKYAAWRRHNAVATPLVTVAPAGLFSPRPPGGEEKT